MWFSDFLEYCLALNCRGKADHRPIITEKKNEIHSVVGARDYVSTKKDSVCHTPDGYRMSRQWNFINVLREARAVSCSAA